MASHETKLENPERVQMTNIEKMVQE